MKMSEEHAKIHRLLFKWRKAPEYIRRLRENISVIRQEIHYDEQRAPTLAALEWAEGTLDDFLEFKWQIHMAVVKLEPRQYYLVELAYSDKLDNIAAIDDFPFSRTTFYRVRDKMFDALLNDKDLTEYLETLENKCKTDVILKFINSQD